MGACALPPIAQVKKNGKDREEDDEDEGGVGLERMADETDNKPRKARVGG